MSNTQSLVSIGALLLFSVTALRVNNRILSTDEIMQNSKFSILAHSLATSLIEEANNKAFDLATVSDGIIDVELLTSPYSLGPAPGELPANYNDFDDYNGYTRHVANIPSADFDISCVVRYVDPEEIDGYVMEKTWHKKITVEVSSPSMSDTVCISKVFSYWNFR